MEYGLWPDEDRPEIARRDVLILVLMEYGLWRREEEVPMFEI